jgi:hypothetical protein
MRLFVATAALLCLLSPPAQAQTLWSRPYEPNQIALEAIAPDADDASLMSGATFLTATASLNENIELLTELPLARFQPSSGGGSSTAVGNPFLGLGLSSTRLPLLLQVGARVPAAPANPATRIGNAADFGRTRAFNEDEFVLSGLANGRYEISRQSTLRLRSGLAYTSRPAADTPDSRDRDWSLHYDAQIWREGDLLITGLSFTGRSLLTSPGTSEHHLSLSLMGNWNYVQPGLLAGTSLNDLVQDGRFSPHAGLTLSISYGRF